MNKTTASAIIYIIFLLFNANSVCSQQPVSRQNILSQLKQTQVTLLPSSAVSLTTKNSTESNKLTLDLIIYQWATAFSSLPTDIVNINKIIPAMTTAQKDQTLKWASQYFSINSIRKYGYSFPPQSDDRVPLLTDLHMYIKSARNYKESYPVESVNAYIHSLDICRKLDAKISEAVLLKELGDQYFYNMSSYRQAEVCYDNANWVFSAYGCMASGAILYDDWGTLNSAMGRYSDATEHYLQAARQWEALANQNASGYKYRDLAGIGYMRAGEAQRAAGRSDKAIELMNNYGLAQIRIWSYASKSYPLIINSLLDVADFRLELGSNQRAIDLLKEAQKACKYQDDLLLTARVNGRLSKVYTLSKQFYNAEITEAKKKQALLQAADSGESAITKLSKPDLPTAASINRLQMLAWQGARSLQEMGEYKKSLNAWKKTSIIYERLKNKEWQVKSLRSLANVQDILKQDKDALATLTQAADIAVKDGQKIIASEIIQDIIQKHIDSNNFELALIEYSKLIPLLESTANVKLAAKAHERRGVLLADLNQYDEAAKDLQNARVKYLFQVGDKWASAEVSLTLAQIQVKTNKPIDARNTLEATLEATEDKDSYDNLSPGINQERSRIIIALYRELIANYLHANDNDKAINLIGNAKKHPWYAEFISQLNKDSDKLISDFAGSDFVNSIEPDHLKIDTPIKQSLIANNWTDYVQTCWNLSKRYQSEYNRLPIDPLIFFKNRDFLPDDRFVIEYMPLDSSLFVFICGNKKSDIIEISIQKELIDIYIRKLRLTLKNCEESLKAGIPLPPINNWQESSFIEIEEPLKALYTDLFSPIIKYLNDKQKLVFVLPDDYSGLPIQALITDSKSDTPTFLIKDYEISYIGKNMLDSLISPQTRAIDKSKDSLAIFADPENNLPGARKEAFKIRDNYLNSRLYLDSLATKKSFLKEMKNASIIHIATHHKIDPNPATFSLTFTKETDNDGKIDIDELLNIDASHIEMITLSACDSVGSSDPISSGTAKAAEVFTLIGAKSVLGGLWKISDEAALELMAEFYKEINNGASKSEAIRRAQLTVLQSSQYAHPFYWACLALYGNPR